VGAQDEGWQIQRADYGFKNQRNNVTDILKGLVGRGGVNGRVAVNNQTMGGDPAVGKDKSLRIFARNRRNEEREFNIREGGFVDVTMFQVRRDRDDWDDRGGKLRRPATCDDWRGRPHHPCLLRHPGTHHQRDGLAAQQSPAPEDLTSL